jgi:hypothetical protein
MANNILILFLKENLQRLFTESPLFFKIWSGVAGVFVLITGVPELINAFTGVLTIPEAWSPHITTAVAWASRAALFMSLMTTQSKPAGQKIDGTILKKTNEKFLPFTAKNEEKRITNDVPILIQRHKK